MRPTDTAVLGEKPSVREQKIQVDGVLTRHLAAGSGPPLLLLHGAGDSLGGLDALQLALSEPERVVALCVVDSAGPGRAVNPALIAQRLPGIGELAIAVGRRRPGAALRALSRAALLFGRPRRAPRSWLVIGPFGQRQVLVKRLPALRVVSGCGHAPQVECPDGFTEALSRFLRALGQ